MAGTQQYAQPDAAAVLELKGRGDAEALLEVLAHATNRSILKLVISSLGELGDGKAVEPLVYRALQSKPITIRHAAIRALGDIGDNRATGPLAYLLGDELEDAGVREAAAEALGRIATEGAAAGLIQTLDAVDTGMGEKAAKILEGLGEPAVAPLISTLNRDKPDTSRRLAARSLGVIGDKRATEPLIAILQDIGEDSDLRQEAVHALGKMRATEAVDPLINAAVSDADYAVRCWSVTALEEIGDSRAVEPLVMLLEDKSNPTRIRGHAAGALGRIGGNGAVEPLARILEDPRDEAFVRDRAAWAALAVADDRAVRPLLMYFRAKLDGIVEPEAADADKMPEVLKGLAKLIDKLLG